MMMPPIGTIHQLRICRHASPAVVARVPGDGVIGWISTPRSPSCRLLTVPGPRPESCTPRQNGALLSGWLRARCALVSVGCGSGGAVVGVVVVVRGGGAIGGEPSLGITWILAAGAAGAAGACCASGATVVRGTPAVPCCAAAAPASA